MKSTNKKFKNYKNKNLNNNKNNQIDYYEILDFAFNQAGIISKAYSVFHNYSARNSLLAIMQSNKLNRPLSPINTFKGWEKLGRKVKKGEKAVALYLPVIMKDRKKTNLEEEQKEEEYNQNKNNFKIKTRTCFILKRNWFFYSQTEGKEEINFDENEEFKDNFDLNLVLKTLEIKEEYFQNINGNIQGYAKIQERTIAINPLVENRFNTTLHEVAHILLHTQHQNLKKEIKEVEAETTSYLVLSILGISKGQEESRGYIQSYLKHLTEEEKQEVGKRIISSAYSILDAGKGENVQGCLF